MKQFLALAAAGILCVSVAGCGKTEELVQETVKEIEKAADDAADKAENAVDEATDSVEAFIPEVAVPDGIAGSYDTGLIMTDDSTNFGDRMIYLPYSSSSFKYDDDIVVTLESLDGDVSIHAWVYEDADTFSENLEAESIGEEGEDKEVQEITLGEYNVTAVTYNWFGWETDYYVDFNGKFGDIPGAYVSAGAYSGDKETTRTDEIKDMIANIFEAENNSATDNVEAGTSETTHKPTMGEKNALKKAHEYLAFMAFSYSGLFKQLEFEGFTTEEATYAVDNCGADWNEQAAKKAKEYLNVMAFSRQSLIEQLEFDGFTNEQALYGVEAVGY